MQEKDVLRRFLFDGLAIRGEWLNLTESWQTAKQHHQYPDIVTELLGEAMAAATLLAATIKFDGHLILQAQGKGTLTSLVAQSTHALDIRGWARYKETVSGDNLTDLLGEGLLVLTIEPDKGEPYQGIVPLTGRRLENAIETYFSQSEQLKTRLWLFADTHQTAGLLIQELPSEQKADSQEDWTRIEALADTITQEELLTLPCEDLLHRLFNEESVRLFSADPINFKCRCSTEKVENTLLSLGHETVNNMIKEQGEIVVDCEFCSHKYHFDQIDVTRIFFKKMVPTNTQH